MSAWRQAAAERWREASLPVLVAAVAVATLGLGGAAALWLGQGPVGWAVILFRRVIPVTALVLNLLSVALCAMARREFLKEEPLHRVWTLAMWAAACLATSGVALLLGEGSWSVWTGQAAEALQEAWQRVGMLLAGPAHTALLAAAFWTVLQLYRRSRLLARPRAADWILIALAVVFGVGNAGGWLWGVPGRPVRFMTIAALVHGPLLGAVLIEAALIWRSAAQMGRGLIARCWGAFTLGILIAFATELLGWAALRGPAPIPLGATGWYLSLAANAAFAMAPAYQIEACRRAAQREEFDPEPALSEPDGARGPAH